MSDIVIYHNPRCSKSRQTLQLLQDQGHQPVVVEYLKQALEPATLSQLLNQLGFDDARQLMRQKEDEYKQQNLHAPALTQQQLIDAMITTPKLIERPIVVANNQAKIGRPPEQVLDIL